jgi:uncharacterized OB-fold protein
LAVFAPVVKHKNKKVSGKKPVMTWRKCPFCSTISKPSKKKCRNCGLKYPFELDKEKSESLSRFSVFLKDPRSVREKNADKIIGIIIALIVIIPYAIRYFVKDPIDKHTIDSLSHFLPGLMSAVFAVYFATKSRNYAERACRSCKKIMVVRVPRSKSMFPSAIECWNCGTIHDVVWDDGDKKTGFIPGAPQ